MNQTEHAGHVTGRCHEPVCPGTVIDFRSQCCSDKPLIVDSDPQNSHCSKGIYMKRELYEPKCI